MSRWCRPGWPSGASTAAEKDKAVKKLFHSLRQAAEKRAEYIRTRDEIAAMPRADALDLGIFPEDAERIARKAVWG